MPGAFRDKVTYITDELVLQCDVQAVKNDLLDHDDNDDCK